MILRIAPLLLSSMGREVIKGPNASLKNALDGLKADMLVAAHRRKKIQRWGRRKEW